MSVLNNSRTGCCLVVLMVLGLHHTVPAVSEPTAGPSLGFELGNYQKLTDEEYAEIINKAEEERVEIIQGEPADGQNPKDSDTGAPDVGDDEIVQQETDVVEDPSLNSTVGITVQDLVKPSQLVEKLEGLSTDTQVGIGFGVCVPFLIIIGSLAGCWGCRKHKKCCFREKPTDGQEDDGHDLRRIPPLPPVEHRGPQHDQQHDAYGEPNQQELQNQSHYIQHSDGVQSPTQQQQFKFTPPLLVHHHQTIVPSVHQIQNQQHPLLVPPPFHPSAHSHFHEDIDVQNRNQQHAKHHDVQSPPPVPEQIRQQMINSTQQPIQTQAQHHHHHPVLVPPPFQYLPHNRYVQQQQYTPDVNRCESKSQIFNAPSPPPTHALLTRRVLQENEQHEQQPQEFHSAQQFQPVSYDSDTDSDTDSSVDDGVNPPTESRSRAPYARHSRGESVSIAHTPPSPPPPTRAGSVGQENPKSNDVPCIGLPPPPPRQDVSGSHTHEAADVDVGGVEGVGDGHHLGKYYYFY